ncbi:MAG TPA: hypothetical protein VK976_04910 [Verrucomicrobiae bacterium]|jgi:hypothetical protein|nr:hypothetical protein [Verrucomicrobiae bacterium]
MDSQWCAEVAAWGEGEANYLQSFHFTFPPESAIVQITLSTRSDNDGSASPPFAYAYFTDYTTADGVDHDVTLEGSQPTYFVASFTANQMTGFRGYLGVRNCEAQAVINVFGWPNVYSD